VHRAPPIVPAMAQTPHANMTQPTRRWIGSFLFINLAVTVMAPFIELAGAHPAGWNSLLHTWVYALVYANITGVPAIILLPPLLDWVAARKKSLLPVVILGCLASATVGCLVAQALLAWTRIAVPQSFWRDYLHTLGAALLLALAFGLGAFFYGSLRDRLRYIEERLQQQTINEERARKLAAEARLRSLESRIHPHFLFNTLNSISSLIAVDPARAEQAVGQLATMLRSSLDHTNRPLIELSEELAMVEDYLAIEAMRLGGKLSSTIKVPAALSNAKIPPFAIQSLVENAVKHGITPQKNDGTISIAASLQGDRIRIEVSDSGPGFDSAAIAPGHGLDNLVERLNTLFGSQAALNILRRPEGCIVQMVLPRT
jgi:two-component system, LytTR family, sensor histidine kinase AlgZ